MEIKSFCGLADVANGYKRRLNGVGSLEFDAVNENLTEMIEWFGNDTRKVCVDCYIDDKNLNPKKYDLPYRYSQK